MIAARCVDLYLEQRNREAASSDKVDIDGRLVAIVERMFERCSCCSALNCTMPPLYRNLHHHKSHHVSMLHWAHTAVVHPCRCFADGQFEQAVGIALEARRLDKLEQTIKSSPNMVKILTYSLQVCQTLVISREFRQQVSPDSTVLQKLCFPARSERAQTIRSSSKHTLCRCCDFSSNCMRASQSLIGSISVSV